jgi:hypothetical protein
MATFTEPTRRLALRWGTYLGRYLAGLAYISAGTVILLSSNTYALGFLLLGTVAHIGGWFLLPATGARRLIAFGPSLIAVFLLLTGPQILFAMAAVLFGWLLVRERPLRSYVVLIFPVFSGVIMAYLFHSNQDEPVAFGVECVVVAASAWLARLLAATRKTP